MKFFKYFFLLFLLLAITGCKSHIFPRYHNNDQIEYEEFYFTNSSIVALTVSYPEGFTLLPKNIQSHIAFNANQILNKFEYKLQKKIPEIDVYNVRVLNEIVKNNKLLLRSNKRFDTMLVLFPSIHSIYGAIYQIDRNGQLTLLKEGTVNNFLQEGVHRIKKLKVYIADRGSAEYYYWTLKKRFGRYASKVFPVLEDYDEEFSKTLSEWDIDKINKVSLDNLPEVNVEDIDALLQLARYDLGSKENGNLERALNVFRYVYETFKLESSRYEAEVTEYLLNKTDIGLKFKHNIKRKKQKLSIQ